MIRGQEGRNMSQRDYDFGLLSADEPFAHSRTKLGAYNRALLLPWRTVQHIKNTDDSKLLAARAVLAPVGVWLFQFITPKSLPNAVVVKILTQNCAGDKTEKNEKGWACGGYGWGKGGVYGLGGETGGKETTGET